MSSSNLIKLAPTLSAEEKFKIIVADVHKSMAGEKPILTESERQAIIMCESREAWEEYTRHISMMQWAGAFWSREIEIEKLRTYAIAFNLKNELSGYISDIHGSMPEAMRRTRCAYIEEWVELLERAVEDTMKQLGLLPSLREPFVWLSRMRSTTRRPSMFIVRPFSR